MLLAILATALSGCTALSVDGNQRKDGVGETVVGQSFARAKDGVCMSNLRQVRKAVQELMTREDLRPDSIADLRLPNEVQICPLSERPYTYNAATGSVRCEHPGHENY